MDSENSSTTLRKYVVSVQMWLAGLNPDVQPYEISHGVNSNMVRASASTVQEWVAIGAFDSSDAQHFAVPSPSNVATVTRACGRTAMPMVAVCHCDDTVSPESGGIWAGCQICLACLQRARQR